MAALHRPSPPDWPECLDTGYHHPDEQAIQTAVGRIVHVLGKDGHSRLRALCRDGRRDADRLVELAVDAEYKGDPPPRVAAFLAGEA